MRKRKGGKKNRNSPVARRLDTTADKIATQAGRSSTKREEPLKTMKKTFTNTVNPMSKGYDAIALCSLSGARRMKVRVQRYKKQLTTPVSNGDTAHETTICATCPHAMAAGP